MERWYSLWFYPNVSRVIVALQDAMPVPIAAVALFLAACAGAAWCGWAWRRLWKAGRSRWRMVPNAMWLIGQGAVLLLLWSLVVWGAGYQRTPVTERWALDDANLSAGESAQLQAELLAIIEANVDAGQGQTRAGAVAAIAESMGHLLDAQGDGPVRVPRQVRATPPGVFLSFSTAGMCVPFAIEPFADGAYDDISFIQVAAHELAHVAGYNRESEATLIGYLAGLSADDARGRYAVALGMYMDLINRIRDKEGRKAAWEALPPRARADYEAGREIAARYRIKIELFQRVGYRVYDTYLKSQGINEGMANYSAGLRLFAGAWRNGLAVMVPVTP